VLPVLRGLGEDLGLIFQIKDDELGLFGSSKATGKPVGSDVRQGKKTLYAVRMLERATGPERARIGGIFGRPDAPDADILFVRALAARLGIREEIRRIMAALGRRAAASIRSLDVDDRRRAALLSVLAHGLSRRS